MGVELDLDSWWNIVHREFDIAKYHLYNPEYSVQGLKWWFSADIDVSHIGTDYSRNHDHFEGSHRCR